MVKILIFIFWIFFNNYAENTYQIEQSFNKTLEVGHSQTYSIEYKKDTNFLFNIKDDDTYQVNIHSINCNFEVDFNGEIIKQINTDTYSIRINKTNNIIILKPIVDTVEGKERENYNERKCHITINSMNENKPEVKIENKEETFFYFESSDSNALNISYEIKEIFSDSFASLSFQFNEKCNSSINIYNNNEGNLINIKSKNIYNSTYIYILNQIY